MKGLLGELLKELVRKVRLENSSLVLLLRMFCITLGYVSDSESTISEVAEEIVMKVIGGENSDEEGGVSERTSKQVLHHKEKENIKPITKRDAAMTATRTFSSAKPELLKEVNHALASSDNRGPKKSKSVRFSVSPPPTPVPRTSPATTAAAVTSTGTCTTSGSGEDAEVAISKEKLPRTLQWKQLVPTANKVRILLGSPTLVSWYNYTYLTYVIMSFHL